MNVLEQSLRQITAFLRREQIPYMLIGGMANMVWGKSRLTQDLDISLLCRDENIPVFIEKLNKKFKILPADPVSFLKQTGVLPVMGGDGIRIDLIFARLPYEENAIKRAATVQFGKLSVKVCTIEDLIIHKIISKRPIDIEDVRWVIKRQWHRLNRDYLDPHVKELSHLLENPEIWQQYLSLLNEAQKDRDID
jgi:predicted nucleotidyltransferase